MAFSMPRLLPSRRDPKRRFAAKWVIAYMVVLMGSSAVLARTIAGGGDVESWQKAASWLVVVSLGFFVVAANSYLKFDATDESERQQLRVIKTQILNATPSRITIHRSEIVDEYRDALRLMFDGDPPEQTTVRESLGEIRTAWKETASVVPGLSMRLVYEGVLILVFGAIVILPVSWWSGGDPINVPSVLPALAWLLISAATAFPGGDVIGSVLLLVVLALAKWVWVNWVAVALALLSGAAVIAWLDRKTSEDLSVVLYPDRRELATGIGTWAGLVYAAGAIPATILGGVGRFLGIEWITALGSVGGFLAALVVAAYFGAEPVRDLRGRLVHRQDRPAENTRLVAVYLLARKVWGFLGLACLPLLLAYAALAIGTGQIFAVIAELTRAPWHVQLSILMIVGMVIALVAQNYPDALGDLREGIRRAASSQLVRGVVFARGIPILAIVVGFAFGWPILGFVPAVAVAIIAGAFARLFTLAWEASKYRFIDLASPDSGTAEIVVEAFTITDADGEPIYIARVDGDELAHRKKDVLVEVVLETCRQRFEDGTTPSTFAEYYFREATDHGHVDIGYVGDQYRADIKTRVQASLREADDEEMKVEDMDSEMTEEYAEPAYRTCLKELERRNKIDVRQGKYVLH